jgi:hypothetical protein
MMLKGADKFLQFHNRFKTNTKPAEIEQTVSKNNLLQKYLDTWKFLERHIYINSQNAVE